MLLPESHKSPEMLVEDGGHFYFAEQKNESRKLEVIGTDHAQSEEGSSGGVRSFLQISESMFPPHFSPHKKEC